MIYTLSTSLFLYRVNRNRSYYQEQIDKRRTFLLVMAIPFCLTVAIYFAIIYRP